MLLTQLDRPTDFPQWQAGEARRIDLNQWRVPDLVGEIADTTLASDLDQKKRIYADLGIPEYWVIDVKGLIIFAFCLGSDGIYQQSNQSVALTDKFNMIVDFMDMIVIYCLFSPPVSCILTPYSPI